MKKKIIKLINAERLNISITSKKALATCTEGAYDYCSIEDHAACSTYAEDECGKDYAMCFDGAEDYCEVADYTVCHGALAEDYT